MRQKAQSDHTARYVTLNTSMAHDTIVPSGTTAPRLLQKRSESCRKSTFLVVRPIRIQIRLVGNKFMRKVGRGENRRNRYIFAIAIASAIGLNYIKRPFSEFRDEQYFAL